MLCKTFTHTQANKYLSRYYSSALYLSRHIKSPPVSVLPFYRANLISMLTMLMKMSWNIQRTISCVLFATNIKWNEKQAKRERARKNKRARENESEMAEKEWASVCVCVGKRPKKEREIERPNQSDEMEIESTHYCHCVSMKSRGKRSSQKIDRMLLFVQHFASNSNLNYYFVIIKMDIDSKWTLMWKNWVNISTMMIKRR